MSWDESDCPIADTILTHSQSVQADSDHYSDQSKLYADKRWVRFPFCEDDIVAAQVGETVLLEVRRRATHCAPSVRPTWPRIFFRVRTVLRRRSLREIRQGSPLTGAPVQRLRPAPARVV